MLEDYHKQIVQYFLHDGAYNEQEMIDLIIALRDRYDLKIRSQDEIRVFTQEYLPVINKHIQPFGMEIKQVTSEEHENETYFVCTQNFKSQFVKLDCSYTEKEAAIFEKLLELIITSEKKCIGTRDVFESLLANDFKVGQKDFGETIARFQRDKWIEDGPSNTVILHARAIVEMQSFIIDMYRDDVAHCRICTRLLIRGLTCSNSSCDIHLHRSCAAQYFLRLANPTATSQAKKNSFPCPSCKQEWNKKDIQSLMQDSASSINESQSTTFTTRNKKQRTARNLDSTARNSTRASNRRRMDDENDDED